jgi:hypothetical protein
MEGIILAIGLSSQSFYSLNRKAKLLYNPAWGAFGNLCLLLTFGYMVYAFMNFEWYVPLLGIFIGGPIASFIQIALDRWLVGTDFFETTIVEIAFNIVAIILVITNLFT